MRLLPVPSGVTPTAQSVPHRSCTPGFKCKEIRPNAGLGIPYDPLILFKAERLLLADAELLKHSKLIVLM